MKSIISRFTMKKGQSLFYDKIARRNVFQFEDTYGDKWMAMTKYGFRVKITEGTPPKPWEAYDNDHWFGN